MNKAKKALIKSVPCLQTALHREQLVENVIKGWLVNGADPFDQETANLIIEGIGDNIIGLNRKYEIWADQNS